MHPHLTGVGCTHGQSLPILSPAQESVKDSIITVLGNYIPDDVLADAFLELINSENGSWEHAKVPQELLNRPMAWAFKDSREVKDKTRE